MRLDHAIAAGVILSLAPLAAQVPDLYDPDAYRSVYLQFNQANWWQQLEQNYAPEIEIPADMTVDSVVYPGVGVRFRGNTSYTWLPTGCQKKSFNISVDFTQPGLDLYGYDHLNLNNGFHDPTFLREFLTYMVCRRHGCAPKANFVKLYLNNQYWGVYINVQQPNKDWAKEWFRSNNGTRYRGYPTSGMFNNGRCCFTWLGSTVSLYLAAYQAKSGDGTDLMNLCNVLNNTPSAQLQAALPAVFNLDQFYRYAACMNIMTQTDSYIGTGKDHFIYGDEIHGDFHTFPFDVNEALAGSSTLSPLYGTTDMYKPALSKTLVFADWRKRYDAHYRNILEDSFSWAVLGPIIQKYHSMISADVTADTKKIYTTQAFLDNITKTVTITEQGRPVQVPALQTLITSRNTYLSGLADFSRVRATLSDLVHSPAAPGAKDTVTVTVRASANAAAVSLWSRVVGPFKQSPMFDDGQHGDGQPGDGVWGAFLPAQAAGSLVDYYTLAATSAGDMTFLPRNADFGANSYFIAWPLGTSPIRINEFVAQNVNGIVDEKSQHEDWVELHNDSTAPVDAGGMYLTDDLTKLKWRIPSPTLIPARGTVLIWADEDGTQGPMHANFKLSASGEEIGLFSADGKNLLDSIKFGQQLADVAAGRLSDGKGPWVTFARPTPDALNVLSTCGLRSFSAFDPALHRLTLGFGAAPKIGTAPSLDVAGGPANGIFGFMLSRGTAYIDLKGFVFLLDPLSLAGPIWLPLDAKGAHGSPIAIPNEGSLAGISLFSQALAVDGLGITASNALEIKFCQ